MSESDGMNGKSVSQWRRWLQSAPVAAFFLLTFLFSWGVWWLVRPLVSGAGGGWRIAVHTVGLCGPTVAALVLSGLLYGWQGVGDLLKRIACWRVGIGWYLFALVASLIIALFWVAWHIPISPILKNVSFLGLFLLEVIPLSILFSWLYVNSRGSIVLVVLYHLVYNVVVYVLNIPGSRSLWVVYIGLNWLLAALVVARYGASRLTRQKALLKTVSQ